MKLFYCLLFCMGSICSSGQLNFRYDNIKYRALYLKEAGRLIQNDPQLLLLDVRSPAEYADSESHPSANIGRLRGSVNISIDSIGSHMKDLAGYKEKSILVYCSHSQRSRAVCKILADSGFKKIYNLNGGMSLINKSTESEFPGKSSNYLSGHPYQLVQKEQAYAIILDKDAIILDLRPKSQFNNTDSLEETNLGHIRNAISLPADELDRRIEELVKYKDRKILLYDLHNSESSKAALKLKQSGFEKIYVLYEGLSRLITNTPSGSELESRIFVNLPNYHIIGTRETLDLLKQSRNLVIVDLRSEKEFRNQCDPKHSYLNQGHLRNAVNLPNETLLEAYFKAKIKTDPVLVYGLGSHTVTGQRLAPDPSVVCAWLHTQGYTRIYLVYYGLYSIIWSVANEENCRDGLVMLADHEGLY
jgi:rhodanese-related sulfurtransferase